MVIYRNRSVIYRQAAQLLTYAYPSLGDAISFCVKRSFECLISETCPTANQADNESKFLNEVNRHIDQFSSMTPPDDVLQSNKIKQLLNSIHPSGRELLKDLILSYDICLNNKKSISIEQARIQIQILKKLQKINSKSRWKKLILILLLLISILVISFSYYKSYKTHWRAEYYDNRGLLGEPLLVRNENEVKHDWFTSSPDPIIPNDNFSARWTNRLKVFYPSEVTINVTSDDGVRVFINDEIVIDYWFPQAGKKRVFTRSLDRGIYNITIEYFELSAGADINFDISSKDDKSIELISPN